MLLYIDIAPNIEIGSFVFQLRQHTPNCTNQWPNCSTPQGRQNNRTNWNRNDQSTTEALSEVAHNQLVNNSKARPQPALPTVEDLKPIPRQSSIEPNTSMLSPISQAHLHYTYNQRKRRKKKDKVCVKKGKEDIVIIDIDDDSL